MELLTEQDAWRAAISLANSIGRQGGIVEHIEVIPPPTASSTYFLLVGPIRQPTIHD